MMEEIKIENITLCLLSEGGNVRVKSDKENVILRSQSIDIVAELIEHNFNVVVNHYKSISNKGEKELDFRDINLISISIVLSPLAQGCTSNK